MAAFILEAATSGRAKCRGCRETILKGECRIGTLSDEEVTHGGDGGREYWHPKCLSTSKVERMNNEFMGGKGVVDGVTQWTNINEEMRAAFRQLVEALLREDDEAAKAVLPVLTFKVESKPKKAKKSGFNAMKQSELKELCRTHSLKKVTGNKDELIERLRIANVPEDN